jgi:hypothetical protein
MGASRTVDGPNGERYFYGWLHMRPAGDDVQASVARSLVVPPPRRVRFTPDGLMQVVYHEGIESFCRPVSLPPPAAWTDADRGCWRAAGGVTGKHFGRRTAAAFPGLCGNVVFSARLRFLRGDRAGLALRADAEAATGWYAVADRRYGRIEYGTLDGRGFIDARLWPPRDEVDLKVVAWGPSVEVYADGRLMIHQVRHRETAGACGYVVEKAEAEFASPRLLEFAR